MDNTTWQITVGASVCIVVFGTAGVAASLYGIPVWYPRYRQKQVRMGTRNDDKRSTTGTR